LSLAFLIIIPWVVICGLLALFKVKNPIRIFIRGVIVTFVAIGGLSVYLNISERNHALAAANYKFDPDRKGLDGQPETAVDQQDDALDRQNCASGNRQACMAIEDKARWAQALASRPAYDSTSDVTHDPPPADPSPRTPSEDAISRFNLAFDRTIYDSCVPSTAAHGGSAEAAERYCSCVVAELGRLTLPQKEGLTAASPELGEAARACRASLYE
jgi:hypothetical protein